MNYIICGCGALGSRIAMEIASPDHTFTLVDDDRVGEENIGTSAFGLNHVGMMKTVALAEMMYHKCHARAQTYTRTVDNHIALIRGLWIEDMNDGEFTIIDTFDNPRSRNRTWTVNTLHVGVSESREGAVMWNKIYPEQAISFERGENPVCTNHLGQQIIQLTAAIAAGVILWHGKNVNFIVRENSEVIRL